MMRTKHGKGVKKITYLIYRYLKTYRYKRWSNGLSPLCWLIWNDKRHNNSLDMRLSERTYFNITYTFLCVYLSTCSLFPILITAGFWLFPFHNASLTNQSSFKYTTAFLEREYMLLSLWLIASVMALSHKGRAKAEGNGCLYWSPFVSQIENSSVFKHLFLDFSSYRK